MILVLFMYQVFIFLLGILRFFRHLFFTFMENLFINHPIFCNGSRYVRRAAAPEGTGDKVLSVHPSLCPSVPPLEAPQRADPGLSEADPGLLEAGPVLSEAGPELGGPALRSLGPPLRGLGQGGMDEWMDGRTDSPCSTGLRLLRFPPEPLPKKESNRFQVEL